MIFTSTAISPKAQLFILFTSVRTSDLLPVRSAVKKMNYLWLFEYNWKDYLEEEKIGHVQGRAINLRSRFFSGQTTKPAGSHFNFKPHKNMPLFLFSLASTTRDAIWKKKEKNAYLDFLIQANTNPNYFFTFAPGLATQ